MNNAVDRCRISSIEATWAIVGGTVANGPVMVGVAHSDYSDAEKEEALEATGAMNVGDKIAAERTQRLVREIGTIKMLQETLNDGKPVKTKLNWGIAIGDSLAFWAYNQDASGPLDTGAVLDIAGFANVWFVV